MKKHWLFLLLLPLAVMITSCDPEEVDDDEEELITTLIYTLTPAAGGSSVEFRFQDLDGDGGDDPIITVGDLAANTVYNGRVSVLNESEDPAENVTAEVEEEDEEHQFFYQSDLLLSVTYEDADEDGNPIGIQTTLTTVDAGSSDLTITLRHEPNKGGANVSDGDITNAGGETDIEVTFSVDIL